MTSEWRPSVCVFPVLYNFCRHLLIHVTSWFVYHGRFLDVVSPGPEADSPWFFYIKRQDTRPCSRLGWFKLYTCFPYTSLSGNTLWYFSLHHGWHYTVQMCVHSCLSLLCFCFHWCIIKEGLPCLCKLLSVVQFVLNETKLLNKDDILYSRLSLNIIQTTVWR